MSKRKQVNVSFEPSSQNMQRAETTPTALSPKRSRRSGDDTLSTLQEVVKEKGHRYSRHFNELSMLNDESQVEEVIIINNYSYLPEYPTRKPS